MILSKTGSLYRQPNLFRLFLSTSSVLEHISKCCLRPFYDEYGNVYIVVDMELKGRIREALLKMICEFEIDEH